MPNGSTTSGHVPTARGATVDPTYIAREVKVYAVLENEVKSIAMFNTLSTALFSLSAGFFFCAVGIWANAAFAEKLTAAGEILKSFIAPGLCVLALMSAIGGYLVHNKSGSTWDSIRKESKVITALSQTTSSSGVSPSDTSI